ADLYVQRTASGHAGHRRVELGTQQRDVRSRRQREHDHQDAEWRPLAIRLDRGKSTQERKERFWQWRYTYGSRRDDLRFGGAASPKELSLDEWHDDHDHVHRQDVRGAHLYRFENAAPYALHLYAERSTRRDLDARAEHRYSVQG